MRVAITAIAVAALAATAVPGAAARTGAAAAPAAGTLRPSPGPTAAPSVDGAPAQVQFEATIRRLGPRQRRAMRPRVWRPGCPVRLRDLRTVRASHWDFAGQVRTGRLVVNRDVAADVVQILSGLFAAGFPIRQMVPIQRYRGSDFASIEADNTSAFNCRRVTGGTGWSKHAYGRAIDINPLENPWVRRGRTEHPGSVAFLDRAVGFPGMLVDGGAAVAIIEAAGWEWGGRWRRPEPTDYQHIAAPTPPD